MNYAQNLHRPELLAEVRNWLLQRPDIETEKYLLFDGAVLGEKSVKKLISMLSQGSVQNIFDDTPFASYRLFAPHLIQLTNGSVAHRWAPGLLQHLNGFPAASFLDASADVQAVRRTLLWLAQAITEDGMDLYCRFADTRVTPSLMKTLVEDQLVTLGQRIHEWRIVDRHGSLESVLSRGVQDSGTTPNPRSSNARDQFKLSDTQFLRMMNAAEADEIFQLLCEGASDLVPDENRGAFYRRLSTLVGAARGCGLDRREDIYQFTVIALATSDEFYRVPELNESWKKIHATKDNFGTVVASWSDETWDALTLKSTFNPAKFQHEGDRGESF